MSIQRRLLCVFSLKLCTAHPIEFVARDLWDHRVETSHFLASIASFDYIRVALILTGAILSDIDIKRKVTKYRNATLTHATLCDAHRSLAD